MNYLVVERLEYLTACIKLSSTTHKIVPAPVRFDSLESFNVELGGTDGMPANLSRYGEESITFVFDI